MSIASMAPITATQFGSNFGYNLLHHKLSGRRTMTAQERLATSFAAGATSALLANPTELIVIKQQQTSKSLATTVADVVTRLGLRGMGVGVYSTAMREGIYGCCWMEVRTGVPHAPRGQLTKPANKAACVRTHACATCCVARMHALQRTVSPVVSALGWFWRSCTMSVAAIICVKSAATAQVMPLARQAFQQNKTVQEQMPAGSAHILSGVSTGIFAATMSHPFDTIKTRMQVRAWQHSYLTCIVDF
jgi:Mitochondrial carrier protein